MALRTTERAPALSTATSQWHPRPPQARVERLGRGWALALGVGWPLAVVIMTALEPAPSEPVGAAAVVANSVFVIFTAAFVATLEAAARRRSSATT